MSERDYESYNILGEALEADNQKEEKQNENTELVTVNTKLQTIPEMEEPTDKQEEYESEEKEANFYEEATYYEEPIKETEEPQKENTFKKEKFKFRLPQFKKFNKGTSFKNFNKNKKRTVLEKVLIFLGVLALLVLLSPFLFCIILAAIGLVGGILTAIFGSMIAGAFALGMTCFIASQITGSMIVAGISLGICGITFGLILLLLTIMFIKWIVRRMRRKAAEKRGI